MNNQEDTLKRYRYREEPILITGCARSGTSLVGGVINICGAFGGRMSGPNKNNQKGMFENARIRNSVVKPFLRSQGLDDKCQYPLPVAGELPIPPDWKARILTVMTEEGYKEDRQWFYKGAKMCLMWPIWSYAFPNAKWIIVRRRPGDIIASCIKTSFMNRFRREENQKAVGASDEKEAWRWWIERHEERFIEMIQCGLNVKIVWPERMVLGDYRQIMETVEWLGLQWNSKALSFIDPKLWKARK